MTITQGLPFASALVIGVFAALVLQRFRRRGGAHLLVWGIGLAMFGIASLAEAYSAVAWHPTVFRLWYLCGAVYTAAWLGQGTVLLLSRRRHLRTLSTAVLIGASVIAGYLVFTVPLDATAFLVHEPLSAQYRQILPLAAVVRKLTPVFNIYGTLMLVGGAVYSAWLLRRQETASLRVLGNGLIAAGGLSLALASTLVRFGLGDFLYAAELLAAVSMFTGFLLATTPLSLPAAAARRSMVT